MRHFTLILTAAAAAALMAAGCLDRHYHFLYRYRWLDRLSRGRRMAEHFACFRRGRGDRRYPLGFCQQ